MRKERLPLVPRVVITKTKVHCRSLLLFVTWGLSLQVVAYAPDSSNVVRIITVVSLIVCSNFLGALSAITYAKVLCSVIFLCLNYLL